MKKIIVPVVVFFYAVFASPVTAQQMPEQLRTQLWQSPTTMRVSFNIGSTIIAIDAKRIMATINDGGYNRQIPTELLEAPVFLGQYAKTALVITQGLNSVYTASIYLPETGRTLVGTLYRVNPQDQRRQYIVWDADVRSRFINVMNAQLQFWAREDNIEVVRMGNTYVNITRMARIYMANSGLHIYPYQNQLTIAHRGSPRYFLSGNLMQNNRFLVSIKNTRIVEITGVDSYGRTTSFGIDRLTGAVMR